MQSQCALQPNESLYEAKAAGCNGGTGGYSGRFGIYEVMAFNSELVEAIIHRASMHQMERLAKANGMQTLQESGLEKLREGITSFAELQRVLYF